MENLSLKIGARRAWNTPWNTRKTEHAAIKPDGGYCLMPAMALLRAWWSYKQAIIRLYDLRVWFALFEVVARRCRVRPNRFSRYTIDEILTLVGGTDLACVRAAIRRLTNAGLVTWSEQQVELSVPAVAFDSELDAGFSRMVELVANHRRKLPVPRRTLRFLARLSKPVCIACVLGHLLRCLYYRDGTCRPDGRCKASWVADVFDVDVRNVKAARRWLCELDWMVMEQSSQTALNRWGAAVRINLRWPGITTTEPSNSPPPAARIAVGLPPPIRNRELSSRMNDQKSVTPPGACTPPVKPTLRDVRIEDLKDPGRLEVLFEEARRRGLTRGGEAAHLRFQSAAAHALRVGRRNPPGLFVSIVRRGLWSFIAAIDEDAARRRLQRSNTGRVGNSRRIGATVSARPLVPTPLRTVVHDVLRQFRIRDAVSLKQVVSPRGEAGHFGETGERYLGSRDDPGKHPGQA